VNTKLIIKGNKALYSCSWWCCKMFWNGRIWISRC